MRDREELEGDAIFTEHIGRVNLEAVECKRSSNEGKESGSVGCRDRNSRGRERHLCRANTSSLFHEYPGVIGCPRGNGGGLGPIEMGKGPSHEVIGEPGLPWTPRSRTSGL